MSNETQDKGGPRDTDDVKDPEQLDDELDLDSIDDDDELLEASADDTDYGDEDDAEEADVLASASDVDDDLELDEDEDAELLEASADADEAGDLDDDEFDDDDDDDDDDDVDTLEAGADDDDDGDNLTVEFHEEEGGTLQTSAQPDDAPTDAEATDQDPDGDDATPVRGDSGGLWPVDRLAPVLEAVLFAAGDPIQVRRICQVVDGSTKAEVLAALEHLGESYEGRGFRVIEVGGGWQLRTAPEHHDTVRKLFKEKPQRLTRTQMETLTIVAYKQPCTRAEVESVRGVDSASVLELLVERRLASIAGRRDVPGRPLVYVTSTEFLELFGLKDLKSLPSLAELGDDIQTLADRSGFNEAGDDPDAAILPIEDGDTGEELQDPAAAQTFGGDAAPAQADDEEGGSAPGPELGPDGGDGATRH